jgi:hypothetical protein
MDGICSMHEGGETNVLKIMSQNLNNRDRLGDVGLFWKILLKRIFNIDNTNCCH